MIRLEMTQDELMVFAICRKETLEETRQAVQEVLPLVEEDRDMFEVVRSLRNVLGHMTDKEFYAMDRSLAGWEE